MTRDELIMLVQKRDEFAGKYGLELPELFSFVLTRSRPPTGYNIRTPFGLCKIANTQEKNNGFQTVFFATRKQVLRLIDNLGRVER